MAKKVVSTKRVNPPVETALESMPETAEVTTPGAAEPTMDREALRQKLWTDTFTLKSGKGEAPGACKDYADYAVRKFDEAFPAKAEK